MLIYILSAAAVFILDQSVKAWAAASLQPVGSIPLIDNIISLTYTENRGAAFNILTGQRWFFIISFLVVMAALIYMLRAGYFKTPLSKWAVALIISGAAGNFIDRLRMGYVVDMFELKFIDFAIFNVADLALTAGAGLLIIYILTSKARESDVKPDEQDDSAHSA